MSTAQNADTPEITEAESPTGPTLIKVFGQDTSLANGLNGLNIALDDSSACGADGCY